MKYFFSTLLFLTLGWLGLPALLAQAPTLPLPLPQSGAMPAPPVAVNDPTQAAPRLRTALAEGTGLSTIGLRGLVLGARQDGVALLEFKGPLSVEVKPQIPFTAMVDGAPRQLRVRSISADGVELEAPLQNESLLLPAAGPSALAGGGGRPGTLEYVEFREVPLLDALRMLADQSGQNFSASVAANKTIVNALLRNLPAESVVEEICKSHNLFFKRDLATGIMRVLTIEEFERDLISFREQQTEVFTLQYPNIIDVALAIANLFGDRVKISLGSEYQDEDINDLEARFDRFDVVNRRGQISGALDSGSGGTNGSGTTTSNNVNGSSFNSSGSGGYSSGSRGYGGSSYQRGQRNNDSRRTTTGTDDSRSREEFQGLTPEQAQRLERALAQPGSAAADAAVDSLRQKAATIFVTVNRRSNIVAVRTADSRIMEEIRRLVHRLDVPTPMVLLEVKVLSLELDNDFRSVFDYSFNSGQLGGSFSTGSITAPSLGVGGGLNSTDMTFTIINKNFSARVQALEERKKVKALAAPLLLTANNEVSRLFLGEERPLVRNISSQTLITERNVATTPNTTIEFRNVGNTLLITPNINSDRTVTLRLLQENSTINTNGASIPVVTTNAGGSNSVQNVSVDVVATRSISGTFVAKDNLAVAIGGLIEHSATDDRAGVPGLSHVPVLGVLFRRTTKSKVHRQLVIMVRPHIISTPADSERVSQNLLRRLTSAESQRLLDKGLLPLDLPLPGPAAVDAKVIIRKH